jgi:RNA polymerase sigma-70 factor (family 1)
MEKLSDNRLMELTKGGNNHAFTALVNRYWENMYKHVHARLRHEDDAKDIVQEIFISVWKNRDTITVDENGTLGSYLFQAARYAVIDHFASPGTVIYNEELLASMITTSGHEQLELKEIEQQVIHVLDNMPERLQLPFRLSRYQHLSNKEIAARLSLSEQTVKNNISITLRHLRAHIGEAGVLFILSFIIP